MDVQEEKNIGCFFLINVIVSYSLLFIGLKSGFTLLNTLYSFAVLLPSISVAVRRAHDVGKSGWYMLIPIYNLVLACTNGDEGENEYGADPKNPDDEFDQIGKTIE